MPDEIEEINDVKAGGSKLPMILAIVAALILGLGGGYGISMSVGGGESETIGDGEVGDGTEGDQDGELYEEMSVDRGIYPLGLFTVNLRGVGGGRVLRVEIEVEVNIGLLESIEERRAGLRDATIKLISDYSYTDVEGLDGKLRLQDDLLTQLNKFMGRAGRIERVYFSQFVVQ